ncbi:MAG: hypothetical protein Q9M82_02800 [Mariprofundus sp.]|nr:hypothetical protein [Mariprofundus sp.]
MISYIFLSNNPSRSAPDGVQKMDVKALQQVAEYLDVDFFLLDGSNVASATRLLGRIRQHPEKSVYLKPVLLEMDGPCSDDPLLTAAVDAMYQAGANGAIINGDVEVLVNGINSHLKEMQQNPLILGDQQTGFRLLRFIASRNAEQQPQLTSRRTMGYSYPALEPFFSTQDESVWNLLELLEQQLMLSARFVSRSYQCVHCQSSFLNFVETCPDCKAINIESDDLIHHFRCGYSAASREFMRGEQMVCPKCTHSLKQIGVDYDKPSLTFRCKECQYVFEEPFVSTICYHCGRRTDTDHQAQRSIYAYAITALGENSALFGPEQLFHKILGNELNVFEYDVFQKVVDIEAARIGRYKVSASSILIVELGGFAAAMAALGQRSTELYKELAHIFSAGLRTSDVISTRGQSVFIMLLVETGEEPSAIALRRITEPIDALFRDSVSLPADIASQVVPVNKELNLNQVVESFLASHAH